jgi:hypothetical protein
MAYWRLAQSLSWNEIKRGLFSLSSGNQSFVQTAFLLFVIGVFQAHAQGCIAIGGSNDDEAYSIVATSDGSYAVAGHTRSFGIGGSDI